MTYAYQNGVSEELARAMFDDRFSAVTGYIKTTENEIFFAKPRRIRWTDPVNEPHLKIVTAVFPSGVTALYCVNMNNGIATFIKFTS